MLIEMVTDLIIHYYRKLLLYTRYFKVREKVAMGKGNFKVKTITIKIFITSTF